MNKDLTLRVKAEFSHFSSYELKKYEIVGRITKKLNCQFHSGVTRYALVFPKERLVFKFCYSGRKDYCVQEFQNYQIAKTYRVERCLLPVELAFEIDGIKVFCQPMYTKCVGDMSNDEYDIVDRKIQHVPHKIYRKVRQGCYSAPPENWTKRAIQIYGKAFMKSFQLWTHDCCVDDLHSGNVGWLGKQPIIIDYAGYDG